MPLDLTEAVKAALKSVYKRHSSASDLVPEELFNGITETLNTAVSDDFMSEYPDLCETIRHNNEVFSAFKVHDECSRMAKLLLDGDGNLKGFEQWARDAEPIASHHNKVWLRTEYDQAIRRAQQARDWKQYEAEADVLPNLRWVPSTAAQPGADHMIFWDIVRPIDDPFWSQHRPGDRWGCQCSLEANDDPVTDIPDGIGRDNPAPGLDGNPAVTGHLFSETHPYYPSSCGSCPFRNGNLPDTPTNKIRDCYRCKYYQACVPSFAKRREEIFGEAKKSLPKDMSNPDIGTIGISNRRIKEWLNQPHRHYAVKNEMLMDIESILQNAMCVASNPPFKERDKKMGIVMKHFLEIEILGDKSWIIVDELQNGKLMLHGISDSPEVLNEK